MKKSSIKDYQVALETLSKKQIDILFKTTLKAELAIWAENELKKAFKQQLKSIFQEKKPELIKLLRKEMEKALPEYCKSIVENYLIYS